MTVTSLLLAALAFPSTLFAIPHAAPKVVGLDFEKREVFDGTEGRHLRKRATAETSVYDSQGHLLYLVNCTIGTPPQSFSLQLDTGSSDIWIPWTRAQACASRGNRCAANGAFDPNRSSTYETLQANGFSIAYVDGTQIKGDYFSDHFTIGGATVNDQIMGLATTAQENDATSPFQGIVGLGFEAGEAIVSQGGRPYSNLVSKLQQSGAIKTRAYSLWLNDKNNGKGTILFGGVDTEKYNGPLVSLPVQQDSRTGTIHSFTVALDRLNIIGANSQNQYSRGNLTMPVILDSGTTLTYLPDRIAEDIYTGVGAIDSSSYGVVVPCDLQASTATFEFGFGNAQGPVIKAKISQFVLPFPASIPQPTFRSSGKTACRWGIQAAGDRPNLFGDTFLRSAYVVYNIDNNEVGIANANFNVTKSNVQEISNARQIPGVSSTAAGVVAKATATGIQGPNHNNFGTGSADFGQPTGTFNLGTNTPSSNSQNPASAASAHRLSIYTALLAFTSSMVLMGGGMIFSGSMVHRSI